MYSKNRELFIISFVILLTVIAWIVVDIYHIQNNTNFVVDYKKSQEVNIRQINGADVIDKLQKRK